MSRFLHVANGTSVTDTLATTTIPGARSIWADPLYDGPVPDLSDEELVELRTRFLLGSDEPDDDRWNDLRRWREVIDDHGSYDELVLWFEHDLFDQLNLIQLLSWLRSRGPGGKTVSLICIGSFPGRPDFHGLGELTAPELESLFDARRPVSDAEYALAERAWQAFRQPTPQSLDEFRHSNTSAMPFLSRALERFLEEFPSTRDGLSRSERRVLQVAEEGVALSPGFRRMHQGEDAYYIGDESFMNLIDELSRTEPPLVLVAGRTLGLTAEGRAVLAGQRDRVAYGLDRWLGGVHLKTGETDMWRWDDDERRVKLTSAK
ncbi:MAG TPA: hypothetical protein VFO59_05620 [Dehalococcoidia bacterium]|nr:hypothetical protein [Dehalococcoidia bacterium]